MDLRPRLIVVPQVTADNPSKGGKASGLIDAGANLCLHPTLHGFYLRIAACATLGNAYTHALLKQYLSRPPVIGSDAILIAVRYRSLKNRFRKVLSHVIRFLARVLGTRTRDSPSGLGPDDWDQSAICLYQL